MVSGLYTDSGRPIVFPGTLIRFDFPNIDFSGLIILNRIQTIIITQGAQRTHDKLRPYFDDTDDSTHNEACAK